MVSEREVLLHGGKTDDAFLIALRDLGWSWTGKEVKIDD